MFFSASLYDKRSALILLCILQVVFQTYQNLLKRLSFWCSFLVSFLVTIFKFLCVFYLHRYFQIVHNLLQGYNQLLKSRDYQWFQSQNNQDIFLDFPVLHETFPNIYAMNQTFPKFYWPLTLQILYHDICFHRFYFQGYL